MLDITSTQIIENICGDFLNTLTSEEKSKYINSLKESTSVYLDAQIAELNNKFESVKLVLNNTLNSAASWATQIPIIATPEPYAPKTGVATLVSLKNGVSQAKAQVETSASQLEEVKTYLSLWGIDLKVLDTTYSLLSQVRNALNVIPI